MQQTAPGRRPALERGPAQPGAAEAAAGRPGGESSQKEPASGGTLVIGREIEVEGKIGSCTTLVIEGRLEASVEVVTLHLREPGRFNGKAEVQDAEVAGSFDGSLTVRGLLLLRPSARVNGEIQYSRIKIEDGGEISGTIGVLG